MPRNGRILAPMRLNALILALLLQAAAVVPALAQEGCENPCPAGQIYSVEQGRCVPIQILV